MKYHDITYDDMKNGDGLRTVLWVSGCDHHCKGCQNPITWDVNDGKTFGIVDETELFFYLDKEYCSGLTLSGGDPLYIDNRESILELCRKFRRKYGNSKTIWLYTGYYWEEIKDLPIMQYIDVLVDGPYIEELRDLTAEWCGSTNQRVIDVQKSLDSNEVVLYEQEEKSLQKEELLPDG